MGRSVELGVVGNDEDDEIYGLGGDDILAGHGGDDYLDGGAGADTMGGGDGDDTYVVDQLGDVIVEENNHNGWDIVLCYSQNSHQLEAGVEELRLMEGAVNGGFGNQSRNVLRGNSAGNILAGEGGDDDLYGNDGDDELHGDDRTDPTIAGNDRLYGGAHNDTLKGGRGNDQLYGGSHGDSLFGGDDDDVLDGGTGGDAMRGEAGNDDYYVENALDQVIEGVDQGDDEVFSTISFTLGENVERLTLQHSGFVIDGTGNGGDNEINGNNSRNTLRGDGGNDHLFGNLDEDTLYGDEGEDELDGGSHDDKLYGGANDDRLYGRSGHDDLNGGSGDDRMEGGSGDDEYTVGSAGDTVVEHWNQGTDTVYAAVSHTLAANVENLILMEPLFQRGRGEAARNGTGNVLANTITGNDEDNTIDGGYGNDILTGGYGNDILTGGDGTDTVSFASWDADVPGQPGSHVVGIALGQGSAAGTAERISVNSYAGTATVVESDQLFGFENVRGSNRYEHIAGNGGNNILEGRGGDDLLMGNGGNDTLDGGQGLDMASYENNGGMVMVWLCQNGADGSALEFANGQAAPLSGDTLRSIEMVRGSAFGDQITGNEGQNTLDGRGGADVMSGLTESDTYIVDNSLDVAAEGVGQGTLDTVRTHVSYALTANSEIEVLETMNQSGTAALNLAGNNFGNTITGNNGANRISGGIDPVYDGQDVLTGRGGADTFVWSSVNQTQLAGQTADIVMDFNRAQGDLLDFTAIDAIANGGTANDDFTFAGVVNVAANQGFTGVGQIGYFTTGTDTFILLNTEVDAGIDFQDATIHIIGGHTVDASWFV